MSSISKRKILIEDLRDFKFISDPQVSPSGDKIAFVLTTIDYQNNCYLKHIWMLDKQSEQSEQFTYSSINNTYPRWSTDGKKLLFLSRGRKIEEKGTQLWVIPVFGGEARQVTNIEGSVFRPEWAPDSRKILFLSRIWTEGEPDSDVRVVNRLKYKQDGLGIFAGKRIHLHTVKIGDKPEQLTKGEFDVEVAKWSPDGKNIALITNTAALLGKPYTDVSVKGRWPEPIHDPDLSFIRDIYLIPAGGGEFNRLTQRKHVINDLSWAPGGEKIAFIGHDFRYHVLTNNDIWVVSAEGGDPQKITHDFDRSIEVISLSDVSVTTPNPSVVWSPDGLSLLFCAMDIPRTNIYRLNLKSKKIEQLTNNKSICGFSFSVNGSVIAYTAMDSTHLEELWLIDEKDNKQITHFNDSLLEGLKLSTPLQFSFKNEQDKDVHGWIIKPVDFENGKQYPTILQMHGGRQSAYGDYFFHEWQVLAAKGYAIIYSNARGSGGYGQDYQYAGFGNHPHLEFKDTMDFVDAAIERFPFIDVDRMGVTGGSYGGYMTNWIISHTNRFKSAVTCRTQVNNVSRYGTADGGYMRPDRYTGDNDYIENMEKHMLTSPLTFVKNIKTPTLIIHSENDLRLPIEQAEQLFVALKLFTNVPTELVRFPDENHDLSRSGKPKHREERLKHILRWFNKYL